MKRLLIVLTLLTSMSAFANNYADNTQRWSEMVITGDLTIEGFRHLVLAQEDLELIETPSLIPAEAKETDRERTSRWQQLLEKGELTQDGYDHLLKGQQALDEMRNLNHQVDGQY